MTRRIRAGLFVLFLSATLSLYSQSSGRATMSAAPVNPHASAEARGLLNYFYSISGKYTLAGQHNYPYHIARWTDRVYDLTGKYPALYGEDFGFSGGEDKDSTEARPELIAEAKRQYENGAVVTLTWHAVRPTDDEPVTFHGSVQGHLTDFEWNELLTPGTKLYKRWCDQADVVAGFLKQLQSAHVPVLFRPYHEMNGAWFWWGGRPGKNGSQALYRQLFERFVNHHKLNNLIWVWNINAPSNPAMVITNYFPGLEYADLLTEDIYSEFQQSYYDDMIALAAGKPIALGEVGALPTPEVLQKQPKWTYFMVWSEWIEMANPLDRVQAVYQMPSVLGRSDPQVANAMSAIRKSFTGTKPEIDPVTPDAASGARTLLAQLYSVAGTAVLSGQQNAGQTPAASTAHVFGVTAKYPSIYEQDLGDFTDASALLGAAKKQFQNHVIVSLSWRAPRPTDGKPAGEMNDRLTDYEWEQLLTPGTKLYEGWLAQVDAVSETLKKLQDIGIPVLWRPYAEINGKNFWWAGRQGSRGSAALYRQLFERMVNHNGVRNLVWVWNVVPPGSSPNVTASLFDFFPGLLYADALSMKDPQLSWGADATLASMSVGKPIGVELSTVPKPDIAQKKWSWFLLAADPSPLPEKDQSLRALYGDARVLSRSVELQNQTDAAK